MKDGCHNCKHFMMDNYMFGVCLYISNATGDYQNGEAAVFSDEQSMLAVSEKFYCVLHEKE